MKWRKVYTTTTYEIYFSDENKFKLYIYYKFTHSDECSMVDLCYLTPTNVIFRSNKYAHIHKSNPTKLLNEMERIAIAYLL